MGGTDSDRPVGVPRRPGQDVDDHGVMRCPPLHAPGIPQQGSKGTVNSILPVGGHLVVTGQLVMRIETEFAYVDIPSPIDGVIHEFLVGPGQAVRTGDPIWRYLQK